MPKELLPIMDKPLIQYAAEEAIDANLDTLIFITGGNKRAIEDHFDVKSELDVALRSKGKDERVNMVKNILAKGVKCILLGSENNYGLAMQFNAQSELQVMSHLHCSKLMIL